MPSPVQDRWYYPRASLNDLRNPLFWRDVAAELLVVTVLMTTVILVLVTNNEHHYKINTTHLGLYVIVVVYLLLEGYGPISGAHMNPCASFSMFLAGRISLARALAYILMQTAGSAAGAGLGYLMLPDDNRSQVPVFNLMNSHMSLPQAVFMEAFFAFNLIFVALSCHDVVNRVPATLPCLPIACCIGLGILAAGTHTGGLMNPIIPFAPAVINNDFRNHWVYWVGPFLGGPTAVPVYKLLVFIKTKYGPKTQVVEPTKQALSKDELIGLLNKLMKSQDADLSV